jgi:hypothetical protein
MSMNVYLGRPLKEAVKEAGLNVSKIVRARLREELAYKGLEPKRVEPDLIIETSCPLCSHKQETTSLRTVQCSRCGRRYQVFGRRRSRVTQIIRGSNALLQQKRRALRHIPRIGEA